MPKRKSGPSRLRTADYMKLASFRYALRRFLYFSEMTTAKVGLTGQQYQAMLVVRSWEDHRPVSINDLANELLIRHNSAVGLVDRLVRQGMMVRGRIPEDRRKVQLLLTARGERVLGQLASIHRLKLRQIGPGIRRVLGELAGTWREQG